MAEPASKRQKIATAPNSGTLHAVVEENSEVQELPTLLNIPLEIRTLIYDFVFTDAIIIGPRPNHRRACNRLFDLRHTRGRYTSIKVGLSVLLVCKQILAEALPICRTQPLAIRGHSISRCAYDIVTPDFGHDSGTMEKIKCDDIFVIARLAQTQYFQVLRTVSIRPRILHKPTHNLRSMKKSYPEVLASLSDLWPRLSLWNDTFQSMGHLGRRRRFAIDVPVWVFNTKKSKVRGFILVVDCDRKKVSREIKATFEERLIGGRTLIAEQKAAGAEKPFEEWAKDIKNWRHDQVGFEW